MPPLRGFTSYNHPPSADALGYILSRLRRWLALYAWLLFRPLLFQTSPLIRKTIRFCDCPEAGRADFIVTLNPKGPAITLINSHDQTGRQCSDDCTMEATSAGLTASEALRVKFWRTNLNLAQVRKPLVCSKSAKSVFTTRQPAGRNIYLRTTAGGGKICSPGREPWVAVGENRAP